MKPEAEKGLRDAPNELRQEIIRLLAELMPAGLFVGALTDDDGDLTLDGQDIANHLTDEFQDEPINHRDADALHDAICEGRRQDAIDMLSSISGSYFRSVAQQRNLFPDRVPE